MKANLFGSTSSPGVASFALKKIATDYKHISRRASGFLIKSFYVDDGLKLEHTVEEAQEILQETKKLFATGNLNVHKIASNSKAVLDSVPLKERAGKQDSMGASERALHQDTRFASCVAICFMLSTDVNLKMCMILFHLLLEKAHLEITLQLAGNIKTNVHNFLASDLGIHFFAEGQRQPCIFP